MKNISLVSVLRIAFAALASCQFFTFSAYAESRTPPPSSSPGNEFELVIAEIKAMIKTDASQVPNFSVHEATPARIEKLFRTAEVVQLPTNIRENGLIFAGLGSSLLTFEKPSDIIAKVSAWFPKEVARAREAKDPRFFGHLHLWGPYEHWNAEPTAFMSLWNCMPQNAWLRPDQNPFIRRLNDGIPLYPIAARQSSYEEFDFSFCVHNRSGYRPSWTKEDIPIAQERLRKMGESVAPLLRSKFASFLSDYRCRGTGPDDCVLMLRLWASLAPSDAGLAAALQTLEDDITPDGPLPELLHPKATWSESKLEDGRDRFDLGLRRAAFLRAKLQSVLNAPQAWPSDALSTTLRQLSQLRQVFAVPFVRRWYQYELDYRNDPINPWRVFDSSSDTMGDVREAVLIELERLSQDKDTACEVFEQWFKLGDKSLQTEYALRRLRRANKRVSQCGVPDFEWLRQQTDTEFRYILYSYLALLEYLPATEQNMLASGLTMRGDLCVDKKKAVSPSWLKQICKKGVSGELLFREELD
jgi:hypothetical protein